MYVLLITILILFMFVLGGYLINIYDKSSKDTTLKFVGLGILSWWVGILSILSLVSLLSK